PEPERRDHDVIDPPAAPLPHHGRARIEAYLNGRRLRDVRGQVERHTAPTHVLSRVVPDFGPWSSAVAHLEVRVVRVARADREDFDRAAREVISMIENQERGPR